MLHLLRIVNRPFGVELKHLGHMVYGKPPIAVYRQVPQNRGSTIRRSFLSTAATLAWL
jgi:hypothetical protein